MCELIYMYNNFRNSRIIMAYLGNILKHMKGDVLYYIFIHIGLPRPT